jgi:hypothetical protein
MKNFLFLFFSFTVCFSSNAQIIDFPDENFKSELLEQTTLGLNLDANNDGEIQISEASNWIYGLKIDNANISDLTGIEFFINIDRLDAHSNNLVEIDLSSLNNIEFLKVDDNLLTSLDVSNLIHLRSIQCYNNHLTSLDFSGLSNIRSINCGNNLLASLILNNTPELIHLNCDNNLLTNLDVSDSPILITMDCSSNDLITLNIKNSSVQHSIDFSENFDLKYICTDGAQLLEVEDMIAEYAYEDCYANSLCDFNQEEDFYTLSGNVKYDEGNDGCSLNDIDNEGIRFTVTDAENTGDAYSNLSGDYQYNVQNGSYTVTPMLPNATYFNIFPEVITAVFPDDISPLVQDFCITPAGSYPDLEILILENEIGYGYYGSYKIVYKNKGTMTQSGSINFLFDDEIVDFNSSTPSISSQLTNQITWDFEDLLPFEIREIDLALDFNTPNDTPPLQNEGEILTFSAVISSSLADETPSNNSYILNQEYFCCLLSTPNFVFSDYFIQYPNPTITYLNLKMKKYIEVKSVTIYNVTGKEIQKILVRDEDIKIDVSNLISGNYFIRISTPKKDFFSRFIKK